jgi:hypothetical protein
MVGILVALGGFYAGSWSLFKIYSVDFIIAQRQAPMVYTLGAVINFTGDDGISAAKPYQIQGWSHPETQGTWTDGPEAELALRLTPAPSGPLRLTTRFESVITDHQHPIQAFTLLANERVIDHGSVQASELPLLHEVMIPVAVLSVDGILRLTLRIHQPLSPKALGQSEDQRQLGIKISQIQISPATPGSLPSTPTPP